MTEVAQMPVRLQAGAKIVGIVPTTIEEVFRLATAVAKSGLAPRGMETAEKLTVAIMHGLEIGLQPMQAIQKIAVVNGRPTVWGDAVPALLQSRGFRLREWIDEQTTTAHCEVTRPDGHKTERTFSEADARKAGLWGKSGPWQQYPKRMLAMRARGFAARDGASDALSGLYIAEELQDAGEMKDITPSISAYAAKKSGHGEKCDEIIRSIVAAETVAVLDHLIEVHQDDMAQMPMSWRNMIQAEYETRAEQIKSAPAAETAA